MIWLIKNELIPHSDSRLARRGGFDPLWRIGITILIIYPRVSPAAAGKPMVIHKLDPPSGSSISKIEINAFGKRSKFYLSMQSATADQTLNNPRCTCLRQVHLGEIE